MEKLKEIREFLSDVLGYPLIHFGGVEVTLGLLVCIAFLFWLLVFVTGRIKILFLRRFLAGSDADIGVRQEEYGESSLNFNLLVWTRQFITRPAALRSELNYAIQKKFRKHGIEITFPQRDLHIKSGTLNVRTQ